MKWIAVFILLFVPAISFAEFHGFMEIGKSFDTELAKAEIELQWWIGKNNWKNELYGGWESWFLWKDWRGWPFLDRYKIGNRIHYRNIYIELEHYCNHSVHSYYSEGVRNKNDSEDLTTLSFGVTW